MTLFQVATGDVGKVYTFTLTDSAGTAIDLTGKTATLRYTTYPTAGATTAETLTVTDARNGVCTWTLVNVDSTTAGLYQFNIRITSTGYQETLRSDSFVFEVKAVV